MKVQTESVEPDVCWKVEGSVAMIAVVLNKRVAMRGLKAALKVVDL